MDVSARTTMKGTAECDKHCELQDSVNQQKVERVLLFRVIPESMFASVSFVSLPGVSLRFRVFVFSCFNVAFAALTHVSWWCWTCATLNIFFGVVLRVIKPPKVFSESKGMKLRQRSC